MKRSMMAKAALMLLTLTFFVMGYSKPKLEVTTSNVREINSQSALGGGVVVSGVNDPIVERGLCCGTQPNPEISGNHIVADGTEAGTSYPNRACGFRFFGATTACTTATGATVGPSERYALRISTNLINSIL